MTDDLNKPAPPDPLGTRVPDLAASLIRTWVPIGVGAVLAWLATSRHIVVAPGASATVGVMAAAACAGGYYALARLLEQQRGVGPAARAARAVGRWMLGGVLRVPVYVTPTP